MTIFGNSFAVFFKMRGSKISVFSKALLPSCDQPTNVNVVIRIRPFLKVYCVDFFLTLM